MPSAHQNRWMYFAQIATRLVCIKQYISTGSKPALRVSLSAPSNHSQSACHIWKKQCVKDLSLNAKPQRLQCAWALSVIWLFVIGIE